MIGFKKTKSRFNLYYLEENEIYTQDLSIYFIFTDLQSNEDRYILFAVKF